MLEEYDLISLLIVFHLKHTLEIYHKKFNLRAPYRGSKCRVEDSSVF